VNDLGVEAGPRDNQEVPAVNHAHVNPLAAIRVEGLIQELGVGPKAELTGQDVLGARRQDHDRNGMLDQTMDDLADRSVSAHGNDGIDVGVHAFGKETGVAGEARQVNGNLITPIAKQPGERHHHVGTAATTGNRVDDELDPPRHE